MEYKIFEQTTVWINQGEREAMVLAVIGEEALIEYEMPKGSTALLILHKQDYRGDYLMRSVSYASLPIKWLREMVANDVEWIGKPQNSWNYNYVGSPKEFLSKKEKKDGTV